MVCCLTMTAVFVSPAPALNVIVPPATVTLAACAATGTARRARSESRHSRTARIISGTLTHLDRARVSSRRVALPTRAGSALFQTFRQGCVPEAVGLPSVNTGGDAPSTELGTMERMTGTSWRSHLSAVLIGGASVVAVTLAIYALREVMPAVATGVLYMLPVLLVSTVWGLWPGVVTAFAGAAAFNFFHIPPTGRFTIADEENWVALVVFLVAAVVTSTLAGTARSRAEEADRRRQEADLSTEMARVLLGGSKLDEALAVVGQRIAQAFDLPWVKVMSAWVDSDDRGRALPVVVDGDRAGTVIVPRDLDPGRLEAIERRVVPSLETLLSAARQREGLEAQVIETRALRRSERRQDRAAALGLPRPALAVDRDHRGRRRPPLTDPRRERARGADRGDRSRERAPHPPGRQPARPLAPAGGSGRAGHRRVPGRRRDRSRNRRRRGAPGAASRSRSTKDCRRSRSTRAQLERALANVIENAGRYARRRAGHGQRPAGRRPCGDPRLRSRARDSRGGAGADLRAVLPAGRQDQGGSGLGLAIARGFVEANGERCAPSRCRARARPSSIQLPLAPALAPAVSARQVSERRRVLVCDDEAADPAGAAGDPRRRRIRGRARDERSRGARRGRRPPAGRGDHRPRSSPTATGSRSAARFASGAGCRSSSSRRSATSARRCARSTRAPTTT